MKEFKKVNQIFIKSNNTTNKIFNRYLYSLIPFILLIIIYNLFFGKMSIIINLLKSLILSIVTCTIVESIFYIIKKEKITIKKYLENKIPTISIILGLFAINSSIIITIISSIVTIIIKNFNKNITISSSLYGIFLILIYNHYIINIDTPLTNLSKLGYIDNFNNIVKSYGSILDYSFGFINYLSPIISILVFIYLFQKKSIKYNIVLSYILTFLFIMLFIGMFNNMNIWYLIFQLATGNILFLSIFCLSDYKATPTTTECQIIYGIILGILTCILRFIIPELSVVIPLILGPLILTKILNKITYKLKYNHKCYYTILSISIILIILTTIIINTII